MIVHRVLDKIFNSWTHPAVMRVLLDTTSGFSGNEIARLSGMHPRSALKALTNLEDLGIVKRQRGGRDHIFTLNRAHYLVSEAILPLYNKEQQFRNEIIKDLNKILRAKVVSAILFGSTARKDESSGSDFDICCIVNKKNEIEKIRNTLNESSQTLSEKYGIKISPLLLTVAEFRKKGNTKLVKEISNDGIVLSGKKIKDLLND